MATLWSMDLRCHMLMASLVMVNSQEAAQQDLWLIAVASCNADAPDPLTAEQDMATCATTHHHHHQVLFSHHHHDGLIQL